MATPEKSLSERAYAAEDALNEILDGPIQVWHDAKGDMASIKMDTLEEIIEQLEFLRAEVRGV